MTLSYTRSLLFSNLYRFGVRAPAGAGTRTSNRVLPRPGARHELHPRPAPARTGCGSVESGHSPEPAGCSGSTASDRSPRGRASTSRRCRSPSSPARTGQILPHTNPSSRLTQFRVVFSCMRPFRGPWLRPPPSCCIASGARLNAEYGVLWETQLTPRPYPSCRSPTTTPSTVPQSLDACQREHYCREEKFRRTRRSCGRGNY